LIEGAHKDIVDAVAGQVSSVGQVPGIVGSVLAPDVLAGMSTDNCCVGSDMANGDVVVAVIVDISQYFQLQDQGSTRRAGPDESSSGGVVGIVMTAALEGTSHKVRDAVAAEVVDLGQSPDGSARQLS